MKMKKKFWFWQRSSKLIWPPKNIEDKEIEEDVFCGDLFYRNLYDIAKTYCGEKYKNVTLQIMNDLEDSFKNAYCAESVHHDYKGGLAEHTHEVASLCLAVVDIFDGLDVDLLISGAVLHDIGKIFTYKEKDDGSAEKTYLGELEEHLYVGAEMLNEYKHMFNSDLDMALLKHMLLSHHGRREWGSPVVCKTKEADILHQCDMMSSRLSIYDKALKEDEEEGLFTKKIPFLEGKVFKGEINEN